MSTSPLDSSLSALSTSCSTLRAEVFSMVTDLDETRLSTVMGSGCSQSAQSTPTELQDFIRANEALEKALNEDTISAANIRKAVRVIADEYARRCTDKALEVARFRYAKEVIAPVAHKAAQVQVMVKDITDQASAISTAVLRIAGGSVNEAEAKLNLAKYNEDMAIVEKGVARQTNYAARIASISFKIDIILEANEDDGLKELADLQEQRAALAKERVYVEKGIVEHFEAGSAIGFGSEKLNPMVIPDNIQQGKGKELIGNMKAFLERRAAQFFAILPELQYCMANAMVGLNTVPPTKEDGYVGVKEGMRELYANQSLKLWTELERKLPKDSIANIRKEFKYGFEEKKIKCTVGDGVTALFCLLALYRPNSLQHRESLKDKLAACPVKFSDGSCPAVQIKAIWPVLQDAMDLGVRLEWSRIGKPIVTALTERNNTFAMALKEYADITNIVELDDSAVEISRMLSLVDQACKDLDDAGISTKRAAYVSDWKPKGKGQGKGKGSQGKGKGKGKGDSNVCWFGADCTRKDCTREHKKDKGKGKKDSETKGNPDKTCKAEGCPSSGRGFDFCVTCHRKLIENKSIKKKDGTTKEWVPAEHKGPKKRAFSALQGDDADKNDSEDQELLEFEPSQQRGYMAGRHAQDEEQEQAAKRHQH